MNTNELVMLTNVDVVRVDLQLLDSTIARHFDGLDDGRKTSSLLGAATSVDSLTHIPIWKKGKSKLGNN